MNILNINDPTNNINVCKFILDMQNWESFLQFVNLYWIDQA